MAYNYGTVGLASIISNNAALSLVVQANTQNTLSSKVRLFDAILMDTAGIVNLYEKDLISGTTALVLRLDRGNTLVHSNAGIQFDGSIMSSTNARANNMATITYINES
jgi:hypothetical protein